jgi:hypothetical protein
MHITILGLGPSLDDYTLHVKALGGRHAFCNEVWGINALGDVLACDKVFHMDDVRVQMRRAEARPKSNIANMVKWMRTYPGPVYTCRLHPDFPGLVEYPLEDVINSTGEMYFNNTAAYALAYAIHYGATTISIFGCDYSYEHSHHAEKGRACLEFWIAIAKRRGIKINLPRNTSLLDVYDGEAFYGYSDGHEVEVSQDGARFRIKLTDKELPTADEVEAAYDHSKPTSPHVT